MPWPSSAPPVASQTTLILSGVVRTPRAAIRQGFAAEYLDEEGCETLLDALGKRNLLSHTYRKALALEAETLVKTCYHPALVELHATLQAKRQA